MTVGFDVFFGIVVLVVLFQPIIGPILIYFTLKQSAKPNIEPHDLNTFPQDVQDYFLQNISALEQQGFKAICYCISEPDTPMMLHFCLLKHANKQDIAMIVVGQNDIRYTEFGSGFNELDISTNNNLQHPLVFPERQDAKKYSFPNISDPGELYTIHRLLIRRDAQDTTPKVVADGAELGEVKKGMIREMEGNVADGYYRFDTTSNAYRPTVKGAVLMTWKMIWPLKNIVQAKHTRKMERVLQEVMRDRETLPAESSVALQADRSTEHNESQQESYKIVFEGAIREDRNPAQVKRLLAKLARTNDAAVERLFTPPTKKVLKRNLSKQEALNYKRKFETTGACCKVFREHSVPSPSPAASLVTAQQPHPKEPTGASSQHNESSDYPHVTEEERASGLLVDIAERFRGGPIKNAVSLPHWAVCLIVLPIAAILTAGVIRLNFNTAGAFLKTKRLEQSGIATQAMVVKQDTFTESSAIEGSEAAHYGVVYRFQVVMPSGKEQVFSNGEWVSKELHELIKPDSEIRIFYDRDNPSVSRIKGNYVVFSFPDSELYPLFSARGIVILIVLFIFGLIGILVVSGLLIWIFREILALFLLRTRGRTIPATIDELKKYPGGGEKATYEMIYRFQPAEKGTVPIIGRQKISRDIYTAYRQENTVDVRYVPKKPKWFKIVVNPDTKSATNRGGKSS
ncbi:MAG: hypothetical protein D3904_03945 [Candidatus Electrothrix sp. EH2]|nr:hypothetical protein [Candidatus Electrothrix sp. EH2]